jgi:hypothetical protein
MHIFIRPSFLDKTKKKDNTPLLLKKKSKKLVTKPLTYIRSDTGKTRHFTPAAQEWFNSIYAYNKNYIKSLSIADKNLMFLLKSYFNSQIKNFNKKKTSMLTRLRRLSDKKIFIGKGEIKHTSSKVIITFYVYNIEKMYLIHKLMQFRFGLLYIQKYVELKKTVTKDIEGNVKTTSNRLFTFMEYLNRREHYEKYLSYMTKIVNKQTSKLKKINKYYKFLKNLVWEKILTNKEMNLLFKNKLKANYTHNYVNFYTYVELARQDYIKSIPFYHRLVEFNKKKFDSLLISKLINIVKVIYDKEVEFNIVNLKKMHLNSNIYTQAVSSKLKNRDNKLYRVLKKSLLKIKLPVIKKVDEILKKTNREEFFINRIRNNTINTMFSSKGKKIYLNDRLGHLLLNFFPSIDNLVINVKKRSSELKRNVSLENYILKTLKHLNLRGIRVEAKGRLTRRFTASRSVFKMRCKGGLKNVDSSFRGLSTIMLRGIVKSNVQYSIINSHNRNGAFGVKAWVSSK